MSRLVTLHGFVTSSGEAIIRLRSSVEQLGYAQLKPLILRFDIPKTELEKPFTAEVHFEIDETRLGLAIHLLQDALHRVTTLRLYERLTPNVSIGTLQLLPRSHLDATNVAEEAALKLNLDEAQKQQLERLVTEGAEIDRALSSNRTVLVLHGGRKADVYADRPGRFIIIDTQQLNTSQTQDTKIEEHIARESRGLYRLKEENHV